jgi:aminoglycoside/choline kinase family phosphotransferase
VVNVPQIIARDREQGFMLLEDLGKITLLAALEHDTRPLVHRHLLLEAVDTLVTLQQASRPDVLPEYDEALLRRELSLFPEWYCAKELGKPLNFAQRQLWDAGCEKLLAAILPQSKVFVHRDFIVRNLMLTAGRPGVLDFRTRFMAPSATIWCPCCVMPSSNGKRISCWMSPSATGKKPVPLACRCRKAWMISTVISNGWACSAT